MDLFDAFYEKPKTVETDTPDAVAEKKPCHDVKKKLQRDEEANAAQPSTKRTKTLESSELEQKTAFEFIPKVTDTLEIETTQQYKNAENPESVENSIKIAHQVRHEVALPPDYDYKPLKEHKSTEPARTYPFTLDPFQVLSIAAIERHESVLVSAHTSAGKTVVAEYAVAQSLRAKQRVIYTSPIKALSNQKFREFSETFGDVGLMTGDVTINPDSSCLVMTTEILRSMLYRGSEVVREVAWVIFDEVHYMRDRERGVIWEETIILLPDNVHYVFLSATIPNAMEFAEWICKTHQQPCHVVYTNYRPTPLQHYLFPQGGSGVYLVVDEKGRFREENFEKAMATLHRKRQEKEAHSMQVKIKDANQKDLPDIFKIIRMIMVKNYDPVIVFSFSKMECQKLALSLVRMSFNNGDQQAMVRKIFNNAISQLAEVDQTLPQIKMLQPLLVNGIGIHHSGLLPILKEVVELLFQEGLIKVLFATETFSIGLNMPARTVVFTSLRKFDGKDIRYITGGEYIQMSGRAGRRGIDDRGVVIMMIDQELEPAIAKSMVKGVSDRLDSAFHLGYNMILNLMRVEGISPEFMLQNCFYQFQNAVKVPRLEAEKRRLLLEASEMKIDNEDTIAEYYDIKKRIASYNDDIMHVVSHPTYSLNFLQPGRLVKVIVKIGDREPLDFGWCVVVATYKRKLFGRSGESLSEHEKYIAEVLMNVAMGSPTHLVQKGKPELVPGIRPPREDEEGKAEIIPITLNSITRISSIRTFLPQDLASPKQRRKLYEALKKIYSKFKGKIPSLDPIENMKVKDMDFVQLIKKVEMLEIKLAENPWTNSENLKEKYAEYQKKIDILDKAKEISREIDKAQEVLQLDELKHRKRVLRKLGFTTPDDIVEVKGRVACEISSGDEIVLTELLFNNTFVSLGPEQCAALLSCFVFDEKSKEDKQPLHPDLREPLEAVKNMAKYVARVSSECGMPLSQQYVDGFNAELMEVVFQWCGGCTFLQISKMTPVPEGSLIRLFRRLEELLRQMVMAVQKIGNEELVAKFEKAQELLGRGIIHSNSLYL